MLLHNFVGHLLHDPVCPPFRLCEAIGSSEQSLVLVGQLIARVFRLVLLNRLLALSHLFLILLLRAISSSEQSLVLVGQLVLWVTFRLLSVLRLLVDDQRPVCLLLVCF